MIERGHSVLIDREKCIGCVDCVKVCPTKAIRVLDGIAVVKQELCTDCGYCIRVCRYEAATAKTSTTSDLKKFKYTVAMPSLTLYGQFGREILPNQVLHALTQIGFDSTYDISWMCEMVAGATDAYLSECNGPWPKISVTCPAIVRLVQIRYPDLIPNLIPIEVARESAAKLLRRKLSAERSIDPDEIGIFFITPCSAIMNSILRPVGQDQSYLDGAFSIAELYGPLLKAIKAAGKVDSDVAVSPSGLLWAMAGGEIAGMRNENSMTVRGIQDVEYVFDRIESGRFQAVDFIEAYICPDGCVSGQLVIEGRYAAQRNIQRIARKLGNQGHVKEEKVRSLLREHFFDLEEEIRARPVMALGRDLKQAIAMKKEKDGVLERLPKKDCAACGAPNCETLADDIVLGERRIEDCLFVRIANLEEGRSARKEGNDE
jgi:Na+-translocating ferredoxin:NAD+ oxidoreductase RNF subunit RnfB